MHTHTHTTKPNETLWSYHSFYIVATVNMIITDMFFLPLYSVKFFLSIPLLFWGVHKKLITRFCVEAIFFSIKEILENISYSLYNKCVNTHVHMPKFILDIDLGTSSHCQGDWGEIHD